MNCEKYEQMILLKQSGELDSAATIQLDQHLASCSSCSTYIKNLDILTDISRQNLLSAEPSREIVDNIIGTASDRSDAKLKIMHLSFHNVIALAAALVIMVGAWLLFAPNNTPANNNSYNLDYAHSLIAITDMEDSITTQENGDDINDLADKLLKIEGFANSHNDEDFFTLLEEPDPTNLQSYNNPVFPSKRHV